LTGQDKADKADKADKVSGKNESLFKVNHTPQHWQKE